MRRPSGRAGLAAAASALTMAALLPAYHLAAPAQFPAGPNAAESDVLEAPAEQLAAQCLRAYLRAKSRARL